MIAIADLTDVLAKQVGSTLTWDKLRDIVTELQDIDDEWEAIEMPAAKMGYTMSTMCPDICLVAQQAAEGYEIRFLRRAPSK